MQMQIEQIEHVEIINWLFMNWKVSFTKFIMAHLICKCLHYKRDR